MTTADCRRVHTKWRDGVVVGAEPARSVCEGPGVLGPHGTAREPLPSEAGGRCETREFANKSIEGGIVVTETHGLLARHRRAAALLAVTPFVAARRCTPTGLKLPIGCTSRLLINSRISAPRRKA